MKPKTLLGVSLATLLLASPIAAQPPPAPSDETVVLPTFDVTESRLVGYGTTNALGATRMNLPITDTPNSIVILNRDLMDDMGTADGLDILKYASGVNPASTRTVNVVSIRGEEIRPNNGANMLDGLPGGLAAEIETEFVERIEFVKGPAGTLYGSHSLGGVINRVSKRPLPVRRTAFKLIVDSDEMLQGSFDATGPVGKTGLSYRVVGVARDGETPNGGVDNKEAIYVYGSFAPTNIPGRMWGRFSYQHIESGHEAFHWFYDGAGEPSRFLGADFLSTPAAPLAVRWNYSYEAGFETTLQGAETVWNLRVVGRYDQQLTKEDAIVQLGYDFYDADGNLLGSTSTAVAPTQPKFSDPNWTDIRMGANSFRRAGSPVSKPNKQYGVYLDLVGDFETAFIRHKLLVYGQLSGTESSGGLIGYDLPSDLQFSVINPVYHDIQSLKNNARITSHTTGSSNAFNFGVQDNIFLFGERLILVGGARYDYSVDDGSVNELTGVRAPSRKANNWVFKAGVVAKPFKAYPGASIFYSYSETFSPLTGTTLSGVPFKDVEGSANELGVKLELLSQGLIVTASVFENENTNFPIRVLNPELGLDDFLQIGTGVSKGWEADIAWQPKPNMSFVLAVSDVDSTNPDGRRKRNVQNELNYRVVGKYQFADGPLDGTGVGGAWVYIADRAGDNPNSFVTEGYHTLDVFLSREWGRWKAQLNIYNVLDEEGVESSIVASIAMAQRPRGARLSLQYSF